jgi:hypothetical protein
MPEASMNENDFPLWTKYEIGFAGKVFTVQAVPIAHGMN